MGLFGWASSENGFLGGILKKERLNGLSDAPSARVLRFFTDNLPYLFDNSGLGRR
jgi:hypothetical protein